MHPSIITQLLITAVVVAAFCVGYTVTILVTAHKTTQDARRAATCLSDIVAYRPEHATSPYDVWGDVRGATEGASVTRDALITRMEAEDAATEAREAFAWAHAVAHDRRTR